MGMARRVAVIGAGWAGLAAAVDLVLAGAQVTVFEASSTAGGRARSVSYRNHTWDCGQHILLGAYRRSLGLMRQVGVDVQQVLQRHALTLQDFQGCGLNLGRANSRWGPLRFASSVLRQNQWALASRMALLTWSVTQQWRGFRCSQSLTVEQLVSDLPHEVVHSFLAPLCLAALNTPVNRASAQVFLRVLHDALFSGRGCSDVLLPAISLSGLLTDAALRFLKHGGATVLPGTRVEEVTPTLNGWRVSGNVFDAVILCTPPREAARLSHPVASAWSTQVNELRFEAISTLYLRDAQASQWARAWPCPMRALHDGPAQFGFNLEALHGMTAEGLWSLVASAPSATSLLDRDSFQREITQQWLANWKKAGFSRSPHLEPPRVLAHFTEKRATFACTAGLHRHGMRVAANLWADGDYVAGHYKSTLEVAVMAGQAAAKDCLESLAASDRDA